MKSVVFFLDFDVRELTRRFSRKKHGKYMNMSYPRGLVDVIQIL